MSELRANSKEDRFYRSLRDVFVGAKVEGESGYINLMRIKSRYFEQGVFPCLKEDIDQALVPFPEFREELFDKLYTFFSRYFSESGSIYFRYTPLHQNVYEKVYTDDRDVMLFYKTHMLYYVKTDRLFQNMDVEVGGHRFFFDVSTLEHKRANEKRSLVFDFREERGDGVLVFTVTYSERGRKTKVEEIRRALRREGLNLDEETLERAFRLFERQSEVDYFINKNARAFLREQFDLWMYQYIFSGESHWTEKRIRQLQVLKDMAYKIISFIAQFEDELVKIWNKPKFVLNSNYVITLDRIAEKDISLVERLLSHPKFLQQVQEWRDLGILGADFKRAQILETDLTGKRLADGYRYLPVDTKYFKELQLEVLGLFDDLDDALDGWLIKSENYQALNTILPKFSDKVNCIYIDPPYNTGDDEFIYNDRFRHSSWLAMMENRLSVASALLLDQGLFFSSIDDTEFSRLIELCGLIFGAHNWVSEFVWKKRSGGDMTAGRGIGMSVDHEYIVTAAKSQHAQFAGNPKDTEGYSNLDNDPAGPWKAEDLTCNKTKDERPNLYYEITDPATGITYECNPNRVWAFERPKMEEFINRVMDGRRLPKVLFPTDPNGRPMLKKFLNERKSDRTPVSSWLETTATPRDEVRQEGQEWGVYIAQVPLNSKATRDVDQIAGSRVFSHPKPVELISLLVQQSLQDREGIVVDFFAGSGTTAHAAINLNREDGGRRKYIMVEMADYFDTVLLPRIKKVVFSDKWKDGNAQEGGRGISHFIKYYQLEQYEDSLRKVKYEDADLFDDPNQDPYHQYVFLRDLKMLEALEVDQKQNRVKVDLSKLYPNIDIAETLSNLTGKWIKRITADLVEFEDGETVDIKNLDWRLIKPLIWW